MSPFKNSSFWVLFALNIYSLVSSDEVNGSISVSADELKESSILNPASGAVAANSPIFKPADGSGFTINLLSSFPEDLEISDYCSDMLHIFGERYVSYVNCLVPAARPVKVCENCYSSYRRLNEIYFNISEQIGPGNESCRDSLLRSDRLMLVYVLYSNLEDLWGKSNCKNCITEELDSLTNDTLYFMNVLNQTLSCFEKYSPGNHTELCTICKIPYSHLNELYTGMDKNQTLCIDIEDAMNMTRRLWSKNFNCSFPRLETGPVIAVSSFMLFLPIIFYLSSFLHSEQKKRKLIHPKRAKSYTNINIQDKQN
ncbi:osteopetrosis-associated transmembrane protein 1 [Notolabrus celidotus]|uniref:osteopetrosis-associated transmembrane protein 1 n=1 Tax=Notolabrus celidotus TaxID=1203425 RepID=UPI0014904A2C|nr:osteopetrosis-associated transmembrane protein 1 [Notolabrus celidotus]